MARDRDFQEVSVTRLGNQTPLQRFGPLSAAHPQPTDDSDSEDEEEEDNPHAAPRVEEWKMNLTALSQYHNLYFAAYGDKIYVFVPQGPQQVLPQAPVLIIELSIYRETYCSLSPLERYRAHVINHIVVGDLGHKEILLCACHDGDVVAYYTDAIEVALRGEKQNNSSFIKPFFAENVGNSAWGLAIHQHSRLIAVGSNSHEVQIFVFALTSSTQERPHPTSRSQRPRLPKALRESSVRFPLIEQSAIPRLDEGKIAREQGFRLILRLPANGHNIPALAFSDDVHSEAQTIIAKDVKGALWFIHIWEVKWKRLPTVSEEESDPRSPPAGWGVIVLPRNFFKPTFGDAETFGFPNASTEPIFRRSSIDISKTIQFVRHSIAWHNASDETDDDNDDDDDNNDGDLDDENENEEEGDASGSDHETDSIISQTLAISSSMRDEQDSIMGGTDEMPTEVSSNTPQTAASAESTTPPPCHENLPLSTEFELRKDKPRKFQTANRSISHLVTNGSLILHTNRHSITLLPSSDPSPPTHCRNALRQDFTHDVSFPRPLSLYDRINMILTIPELSLVLVASQIGRVALITVTRPVNRASGKLGCLVSMRVDLILPFSYEETKEKIRPSFGLLGMAVGPMQREMGRRDGRGGPADQSRSGAGQVGPRRWRLMLHYLNHAVLSYEISRDEETEELLAF